MSIVTNFRFKQYGPNEVDKKGESMADQLRGMSRSIRDYGPDMKAETLAAVSEAANNLLESVAALEMSKDDKK